MDNICTKEIIKHLKKNIILISFLIICSLIFIKTKETFKIFSLSSNKDEFICSKKCCSIQWPISVKIKDDNISNSEIGFNKKYNTSNMFCNDSNKDSGCICAKNNI